MNCYIDNTQVELQIPYIDGNSASTPPLIFARDILTLTNTVSTSMTTSSYGTTATPLFANCVVSASGTCSYNSGIFTIGATGIYYLHFAVKSSAGSNMKGIALFKGGGATYLGASSSQYGGSITGSHQISQILQLTAGDALDLFVFCNGVSTTFTLDNGFKVEIIRLY